ncbi:MAG: type I methionyl aminopeptidase [Clostridia bacterium]|nr:type I methionyl aminopeptidase [Clostridia bacterium]
MAIRIKNKSQIDRIKKAGEIVAGCFEIIKPYIKDGVTTKDLERVIADYIKKCGGTSATKGYGGFPGELCISVNDTIIHGIPSNKIVIHDGDIVSLDIMVWYESCVADACRTYEVGEVDAETHRLVEVTKQSFFEGIKYARSGHHLNEIGTAIQKYVEENGFNVIRDFVGHGVGIEVHEEPEICNYDIGRRGPKLEPGMVLAIEPMVSAGDWEVDILDDEWTVVMQDGSMSAHYENTVLITDGDPILLTIKEDE